jgi:Astacin (Peptidase family M12A).
MKKNVLIAIASMMLLSSCQQEDILNETSNINIEQASADPHVCTELYHEDNENSDNDLRASLWKSSKWPNGSVIKVKFLNGSSYLQNKVKKYATEWTIHGNIKFQFVASNQNADIKVAFKWNGDAGSWSYVGTDCKYISQNQPSINFGWFDSNTADSEFSRTIIHEFGHALGLKHEHQHPTNTISWNKPVVYAYYAKQGWDKAKVDHNIFAKYSTTQTNYSSYDRYSIMHYNIPASHTTNGYTVGWNRALSSTDKTFISQQYPYPANTKGFYRYYLNNHHFYTSNYNELGNNYFEQIMGRVYSYKASNTFPIYRYYNTSNGDRLSTLNWNELKNGSGSWRYEGVTGYAYKSQQANTIPVYRYYRSSSPAAHFLTTSSTEVAGGKHGFKSEGIAFYILRN